MFLIRATRLEQTLPRGRYTNGQLTHTVPNIIIFEENTNCKHNKIYYTLRRKDDIKVLDNTRGWQECGATRILF